MSFYSRFYEKEGPGVDKNAPKPRGLRAFFCILVREWKPLVQLNLIFLIYCLPVFTIGAACGAMTSVTLMMVRDQPYCSAVQDFRDAFRENFRRYSAFGWFGIACIALLCTALCVYFFFSLSNGLFLPLFALTAAATLVFGLSYSFLLPLCDATALPFCAVLKNALLLGAGCLRYSLPALLCELLIGVACLLFFPIAWMLMLVFAFSLLSLIGSFAAWAGIRRHVDVDKPERSSSF